MRVKNGGDPADVFGCFALRSNVFKADAGLKLLEQALFQRVEVLDLILEQSVLGYEPLRVK